MSGQSRLWLQAKHVTSAVWTDDIIQVNISPMIQIGLNAYPLSGPAGFFPPEPVTDTSSRSDNNTEETAHNLPEKH